MRYSAQPPKKNMAIAGTTAMVKDSIHFLPCMSTSPTAKAVTMAVSTGERWKTSSQLSVMALL